MTRAKRLQLLFNEARDAQHAFWDALLALETELGEFEISKHQALGATTMQKHATTIQKLHSRPAAAKKGTTTK